MRDRRGPSSTRPGDADARFESALRCARLTENFAEIADASAPPNGPSDDSLASKNPRRDSKEPQVRHVLDGSLWAAATKPMPARGSPVGLRDVACSVRECFDIVSMIERSRRGAIGC